MNFALSSPVDYPGAPPYSAVTKSPKHSCWIAIGRCDAGEEMETFCHPYCHEIIPDMCSHPCLIRLALNHPPATLHVSLLVFPGAPPNPMCTQKWDIGAIYSIQGLTHLPILDRD